MRLLMTALLSTLALAAHAQRMGPKITAQEHPDAYWNRGFGCSQTADSYNVTLRVGDVDAMAARIDAFMTDAGAPSQMGTNNNFYSGGAQRGRQLNYSVPIKAADKLAKKLMDMGELINYSLNRNQSGDSLAQIEERIAVLEGELKNGDALAKLPSAAHFLNAKLKSLKQSREVCLAGATRSSISVNLQAQPAK